VSENLPLPVAGFIGLGNIGFPMAKRALANPSGLVVFDVRAEACEPLVRKGAIAADSVAAVARTAQVISIVVRDDDQVREVVAELLAEAREGAVYAIHSTVSADTASELAELAAPFGVAVVDAPISGGAMGAANGTLAVMIGGTVDAAAACEPVFSLFASLVVRVGDVGAGTRTKLARNLMHFVAFAAAGEASRLAEAAGIDLVTLGTIVRHSDSVTGGPGAIMLRETAATLDPSDPWFAILSNVASLGGKDLCQALELGAHLGVDLPLAQLANERLRFELGLPDPTKPPVEGK
jgi:3-hydroxyisobutyrate dehydrogenase